MALSVTHTVAADITFSASGSGAWNAPHTVSGTVAGSMLEAAWPVGSVFTAVVNTNPNTLLGFGTWAALGAGQMLVGINTGVAAFNTLRATGGASSFTALTKTEVSGTNAISLFREASAGTNAASVASGSVSMAYPTGVPTFAGTSHRHELPIIHTDNTVLRFLPTATFGVGVSRVPDVRATVTNVLVADVTNSGVVMMSNTVTAAGIISWPATAPSAVWVTGTAAAQVFTGVTGSVSGQVFTGLTASASVSVQNPYFVVFFWERLS